MKAVLYNKKASPHKLILSDVEKPVPTDDEVLIKIVAVSINAADYRSMKMGAIPKKKIFGADIAGVVESVGKNVNNYKPGDEVMGDLAGYGFGGLAEYAVSPEKLIAIKPEGLSFRDAAAMPMASMTALQALRNIGKIEAGNEVLIAGAGGGVGTFAVQLAHYWGARVSAVCSSANTEQTKALGADHVIDYTKEDFRKDTKQYDLILAVNGNYAPWVYTRMLKKGGICVVVGGGLPQIFGAMILGPLFATGGRKIKTLAAKASSQDIAFLAILAAEGKIRSVIDRTYPLEQTAEAMAYASEGHARGKVIIILEDL